MKENIMTWMFLVTTNDDVRHHHPGHSFNLVMVTLSDCIGAGTAGSQKSDYGAGWRASDLFLQ
jgi:hypothetical protein